jgi:ADP-heptose:LPS heptosyltransferase
VPCREHIGDIVNTTGAIACLREHFPSAHLVVEIGERAVAVLENFPGIDEIWVRPTRQGFFGKISHVRRLRRAAFDLAVIFDDSNSHVLHAKLGGIPLRVGIWRGVKYEDHYCAYVPYVRERHELRDHCQLLLEMLGCDTRSYRPRLYISEDDTRAARAALGELSLPNGKPIVGPHPGASLPIRRWPVAHFAQLIDGLAASNHVLLLGGESDGVTIEQIRGIAAVPPAVLNKTLTILQFAALAGLLDALICGDTGPMHLAAVMGTRVVALYGPSYPEHTGPFGEGHQILQESCHCPERNVKSCSGQCLKDLRPERVLAATRSILGQSPPQPSEGAQLV